MVHSDPRRSALAYTCVSVLLAGCPDDPVPATETADGSSSEGMSTSTTTTTTTTATTTAALDSSSGPGTTSNDGLGSSGADVSTTTASTSSSSGVGSTGEIAVCGNNIIEGDEVCDLAQINGESCASLGYQGGQLGCLLTCEDYNLLGCFICGNEVIDTAEDCEGTVPEDLTCESLGFQDGWVTCGDDCLYDVSECSICGDGIASGSEQCDGIDFSGQTCASVGFDSGNLACNLAHCAFVYSGCVGGQYLQTFEASLDIPIEFDVDPAAPWTVAEMMPINGTRSARSGSLPVGGTTNLTLQASFVAAGTVSFEHRESTAAGWDFLYFLIDGVQQGSWSGINIVTTYMAPVAAGDHTFQWRFSREGFIDGGSNQVWVDDITLVGGVPM